MSQRKRSSMFVIMFLLSGAYVLAYPGCIDPAADNYNSNADSSDGSCVYCTQDQLFVAPATCCNDLDRDGACDYLQMCVFPSGGGCTDPQACNYDPNATKDVGNCIVCPQYHACTPSLTSCCLDPDGDGVCGTQTPPTSSMGNGSPAVGGCMDTQACNYDANADYSDGSCTLPVGCNDWCPGDSGVALLTNSCGDCAPESACQSEDVDEDTLQPEPSQEDLEDEDPISEDIPQPILPPENIENENPVDEGLLEEDAPDTATSTNSDDNAEVGDEDILPSPDPEDDETMISPPPTATTQSVQDIYHGTSYPTVSGALYIDTHDTEVSEKLQSMLDDLGITEAYQPFENLDIDTWRIEFDPTTMPEEMFDTLYAAFGDDITFAEPIPLVQINLATHGFHDIPEQYMPVYLEQIGYDTLLTQCSHLFNPDRRKVRVAIVDNGYQSHEDLDANVVYQYDVADQDRNAYIDVTNDESCAHGNIDAGLVGAVSTNDVGIISAGYYPELVLIKATPDGAPCTDITTGIEGLAKAADYADIINVSRGVSFDSKILKNVVDKITEKGVIIVGAAGNFSSSKPFYPAAYENVIAVGAVDSANKVASFSNHGSWVNIAAPGVDMVSTALDNKYTDVSGTSQAAPLVAGWLSFLLAQGEDPEALFSYITQINATRVGVGVINAGAYCADACQPSYDALDYTDDGVVDEEDIRVLRNRVASNTYRDNNCSEQYVATDCCPPGKICDLNDDGIFDTVDLQQYMRVVQGDTTIEIYGDGIDNNCDGVIDREEHDVAPVAQTASRTGRQSIFGGLGLLLLLAGLMGYFWRRKQSSDEYEHTDTT